MTEGTVTIMPNIDTLCRTCLCEKPQEELTSLYKDSLDDMLFRLTAVKVTVN